MWIYTNITGPIKKRRWRNHGPSWYVCKKRARYAISESAITMCRFSNAAPPLLPYSRCSRLTAWSSVISKKRFFPIAMSIRLGLWHTVHCKPACSLEKSAKSVSPRTTGGIRANFSKNPNIPEFRSWWNNCGRLPNARTSRWLNWLSPGWCHKPASLPPLSAQETRSRPEKTPPRLRSN